MPERPKHSPAFRTWVEALEARHLADLRVAEVTRALRALSSAYVERRGTVRDTLDTAGKRAAFALFYAPLHFLTTQLIVRDLQADAPAPRVILDAGCGTGAAGAAWAVASHARSISGVDRHPWAVAEANWTYRHFALAGRARQGDVGRLRAPGPGTAVIAAFVLNELPETARSAVEHRLLEAAGRGHSVLIIEPIARRVAPWWDDAAARLRSLRGRADEWRFPVDLPPLLRLLDKAAGLDHRELTARSIYCPGRMAG
ncbi:MAG: hypothetical protein A3F70_01930 [Acidobacteria bacterium RIFCSPLOWO2_12_FULL_67_14]|nr:MAG: hypothetical protein A3H29_04725 [Acidobacteria bacterium RIFCSPLOWO2_02_FULL_67_21]OFW38892.1 MAG: hypothetical protein A3F70_01930 [Acidobacteria bacterium RIFCSPLOWO2_12_FULL_67_14]